MENVTKPGKYGTLYLHDCEYTQEGDPGFGTKVCKLWGYNREHAQDRFEDSEEGFLLLAVKRSKAIDGPRA